jgi:hypothetical protein
MHLIVCVSGMHGKKLGLTINNSKKIRSYTANRKLKCNFIFLYYDIYLQYTGLNLSQFKIFLISIKEILKNCIDYPKLMFYYLFTRYEFKVINEENNLPVYQLEFSESQDVWFSRRSHIQNLVGDEIGFVNDINKFRMAKHNRVFVLGIKRKTEYSYKMEVLNHIEKHKLNNILSCQKFDHNEVKLMRLDKASLTSSEYAISGEKIFMSRNYDVVQKVGWPTNLLFFKNGEYSSMTLTESTSLKTGVTCTFSINWYHFIVETLPLLILMAKEIKGIPFFYFEKPPLQIIELIELITGAKSIQIKKCSHVKVEKLLYIQDLRSHARYQIEDKIKDIEISRTYLERKYTAPLNSKIRKLYLARESHLFRKNSNEIAVQDVLKGFGYEILYPNRLSLSEQFSKIQNADYIISQTGAGLTNMFFLQPQSTVIELRFGNYGKNFWSDYAQAAQLNYKSIDMKVNFFTGKSKVNLRELNDFLINLHRNENT